MKRILSVLLLNVLFLSGIFGATINSKQGYFKLSWGTTVEETKKAGCTLTPISSEYTERLYSVPVDAYKVTTKDKNVSALQFHYYKGSLFLVTETLSGYALDPQKLAGRYGDFNKKGISRSGRQYTDAKFEDDGSVFSMSISISANSAGAVVATMYDWNTYRFISVAGQRLANRGESLKTLLSSELERTAKELLKGLEYELSLKKDASQAKLAFYPLTTDYNNVYVENHITDTLSQVMLGIGRDKIEIYERAKVERLLEELHFQESAFINQDIENVKQTGKGIGVEYVCYGDLKDLGDRFTVNARIVNVESGKICAMSTDTIKKDDYLRGEKPEAKGERKSVATSTVKTSASAPSGAASTPAKAAASSANNAWKVTKYTDSFAGFTKYIFTVNSSDSKKLLVSYQKYDNPAYNRVIAGIYWGYDTDYPLAYTSNSGEYDIKGQSGMVTKKLRDDWKMQTSPSDKDYFWFACDSKAGARWLVDIMRKSDSVAVRRDGLSRRFQTAGLLSKMSEYGITWEELDAALQNEEF